MNFKSNAVFQLCAAETAEGGNRINDSNTVDNYLIYEETSLFAQFLNHRQ